MGYFMGHSTSLMSFNSVDMCESGIPQVLARKYGDDDQAANICKEGRASINKDTYFVFYDF